MAAADNGKRDAEHGDSPPSYEDAQKGAPPTYEETIAGRLQKAKAESAGTKDFALSVCRIIFGSAALLLGCVIFAAITMSIPIAMIVMGAMHKDECPAEPYIPVYLIVCGAFSIVSCLMSMCMCVRRRSSQQDGDDDEDGGSCGLFSCCISCLSGLIGIFLFAWFIAGNVWIYRTNEPTYDDVTSDDYCHKTLYLFSFWLLTTTYILLGCSCCLSVVCACCASICGKEK
ncbi:transmembrane protein 272-like [Ptychodera flava]|uniref:transmembrane protein 272-like n=1 Tax=Ptychodera flava TaxID=63121 RepID=UPI00396A2C1B